MSLENKLNKLKDLISHYNSAVLAFSGGVDSTFLARVSKEVLKNNILLITATSSTYPFYELEEAKSLAKFLNIEHLIINSEELDIPGFKMNPPNRCYYCKSELFTLINHIAKNKNFAIVFDGSNADDLNDYRPGRKAIKEHGVVSPLCDAGLTKAEIRKLSEQMKLPTFNKPAYACLASRFPYGEEISKEKLNRVAQAEKMIRDKGFNLFRVRSHENLARLEFDSNEIEKGWKMRNEIQKICLNAGFNFVAIDVKGYRTGAMNEVLENV